jgi:hypothetical protein
MNRRQTVLLILSLLFCGLGLHSLILFLTDPDLNFIYGFISIGLLIPGSVLLLATFESKIRFSLKNSLKT